MLWHALEAMPTYFSFILVIGRHVPQTILSFGVAHLLSSTRLGLQNPFIQVN